MKLYLILHGNLKLNIMKRQILFRGKSIDKNEFVYGLPYSSCYDEEIDQIAVHDYHVDIRPETIGQFTGLTDKNGVNIFEGDIIRYGGENGMMAEVQWNEYDDQQGFDIDTDEWEMEIVGNIYEK